MEVIPPHFEVSTAFFCPCFIDHFLKCLQEKLLYSDQILRFITRQNPISAGVEMFERHGYVSSSRI